MQLQKLFILVISTLFLNCEKSVPKYSKIEWSPTIKSKNTMTARDLKNWHLKDIIKDSIPGISLFRAFEEGLAENSSKKVIIAILDTGIDLNHDVFKKKVWRNEAEMRNNNKDDDGNGYVDDITGWNFLGNQNGESLIYSSSEAVRIIRKYERDSTSKRVSIKQYESAKEVLKRNLEQIQSDYEYVEFLRSTYPKSRKALKKFFVNEEYSATELDSLYEKYLEEDKELADLIYYMSDYIKYGLSEEWIDNYESNIDKKSENTFNINYDDRLIQGDDEFDLNDKSYGNAIVDGNLTELHHGTQVASVVVANNDSITKSFGVCEKCKIMPISISANGSEHDKDIALGIRYAVDNGAKVINMSFGKELSLNRRWVYDALKYASENNVLVVSSAGNSAHNLTEVNDYYPNDNDSNSIEVSDTFILVGSSSNVVNENLLSYYSNYGKYDVDLYAPGESITTAVPFNNYKLDSGTSLSSAIVSGIAGLILSKYPNLDAREVKDILLDSGIAYNLEVKVPTQENPERTIPFNQLSKSGKIVNAYNALIIADSISKNK